MTLRFATRFLAGTALALGCALGAAAAQPAGQGQQSGAMQGMTINRDQPMRIESNTLEVRDKVRQATFAGDVKLTQGDTIIKSKVLVVFYEDTQAPGNANAKKGAPPAAAPQAQQKSNQQIKRAEAKGDVLIIQKDQTATGDNGVYDVKSNTFVMTGTVVVTQGQAVMRGERMVVDLTTGITKVDSTKNAGGRVEFMTTPGAPKDAKATPQSPAPAAPAPAATPPSAKAAPKGPLRLN